MTVSQISELLWGIAVEFMSLELPIGQYRISFMTIFLFAVIGRLMMIFINRVLDRTTEEEG